MHSQSRATKDTSSKYMCGIFGILAPSCSVSEDILQKTAATLAHRGPDDAGTVVIHDTSVRGCQLKLFHTRLSIIDLSPLGHQPMQDPVTGNWIVFNGEIYNFRELRQELEAAGVEFKSHSDTEVIFAAYRIWGESCLTACAACSAFALWDAPPKPCSWRAIPWESSHCITTSRGRAFMFASEVRTLLQTGLVPRKADPTGVLSYPDVRFRI